MAPSRANPRLPTALARLGPLDDRASGKRTDSPIATAEETAAVRVACDASELRFGRFRGRPVNPDRTADAVVVGAGLNGAATAFFLSQLGVRRIAILDSGLPGDGASGDAAGLLRTHYDNQPEAELAVRSMPFFREWPDRIGGTCGWMPTGFFRFIDEADLWKLKANAAVQRELWDEVQVLDRDDVRALHGDFVVEDIAGAVFEPGSGTSDNAAATRSLLERVCGVGGELWPFTPVSAVIAAGDRVTGVRTSRGAISTAVVVIAAGSGSRRLAASCGVDLPCEPRGLSAAEIRPIDGYVAPGSYMDPVTDSWLVPRADGRFIIPAAPDGSDTVSAGLDRVVRRVPGLAGAVVLRTWTREDAFAPDGKPVIGDAGVQGLYVNTASAGKGHKVAPAAGLALSELIVGGEASTANLAPFRIDRFWNGGRPWSETEYAKQTIG
jgi:sarcosine oxidase subunit beta